MMSPGGGEEMHVHHMPLNPSAAACLPSGTKVMVIEDTVSPQGVSFLKGQVATFMKLGKNGWSLVREKTGTQCWLATQHLQVTSAAAEEKPGKPASSSLRAGAEV